MIKNNNFSIEINELHLSKIKDICLNVIVGTPQNLQYLMEKDQVPGRPWVIVQKLTKEIIQQGC